MASIKDYDILLREKTDSELRNYFPITKTDNVMVSTDKSLTTYLKELELMHYKYDLGLKKLNNIEDLAEVNQNAYSKVKFGFKSVSAKNKTDTLSLAAGENISIDSDENDNIVISSTYHEVPMADEFQAGKMSRADYIKLQGIESYANNYIHPKSGVVAGLYSYIRVDDKGHIIEGMNEPVPVELGGTGVKSYTELGEKLNLDALVKVDNTVTATGKNPVSGSAVYDALLSKAEKNHGLHVPDTSITTSDGITFLANNNTWQSVRAASITQSGVIRLTSNYDDVIDGRVLTPEAVRQGDAEVKSYVDKKFSDLIGGAPETLDTIYELASVAEQHTDLLTRVDEAIGKKVDRVDGKGLSTNDYTTEDKNIVNRANTHMSNTSNPHNVTKTQIGLSDVTNDKQVKGLSSGTTEDNVVVFGADGYSIKDSGHTIKSNVPENAKFTDTIYTMSVSTDTNKYPFVKLIDSNGREVGFSIYGDDRLSVSKDAYGNIKIDASGIKYNEASESGSGFMSKSDYIKLKGIEEGANKYVHPTSGVVVGTYLKVSVDKYGHVISGSNEVIAVSEGGTGANNAKDALINLGIKATATEINYLSGVTANIQDQLSYKVSTDIFSKHTHPQYSTTDHTHSYYSVTTHTHTLLSNLYSSRPASANISATGSGGISTFKATSSMTTGKPATDGHIIHFYWDNNGGSDSQLCIPTVASSSNRSMQYRGMDGSGTWGEWKTILDSSNYGSYALPLSGGTLTGPLNIRGTADSQPLKVRGIVGSTGADTVEELYLQFGANNKIRLGNTGAHSISADGSEYTGNAATATKATSATYSTSAGYSSTAAYANYLAGFVNRISSITWGTLSGSDYTYITRFETANGGSIAFADKSGQTSFQVDGFIYQNEGNYLCLDTNNYKTYCTPANIGAATSSHTHSIYSTTAHTHSIYSPTNHSHSQYSVTSHTHSIYSTTAHSHSQYSLTSHTHSYLPLSGGTLTGAVTCNSTITFGADDAYGIRTATNNTGSIGEKSYAFYQAYINNVHANRLGLNSGASSTATYTGDIFCNTLTENRQYVLPDSDGQIALTHQLSIYSTTAHSHSQYSLTNHTHSFTDVKVTQTAVGSDYTSWRPLVIGSSNSSTEGFSPSTVTDGTYTSHNISCQPSSGTIRANTFKGSLSGKATSATYSTSAAYASKSSTANYATSAGMSNGNFWIQEGKNIILRPSNTTYTAGIGYDTAGNECIALWAKNSVTRLRWYAGTDMSTVSTGSMMNITPDFEVSKASGSAIGYIGGSKILTAMNIGNYAKSTDHFTAANGGIYLYVNGQVTSDSRFVWNGYHIEVTPDGSLHCMDNAAGPYITNNTGYRVTFEVKMTSENLSGYTQWGYGTTAGSLPNYQNSGAYRTSYDATSSTTASQVIRYDVPNGYNFFFGCYNGFIEYIKIIDTIFESPGYAPIKVVRSGSTYYTGIQFYNSNGYLGSIAMGGSANSGLYRYNTDELTNYLMLDTSNYSSYALPNSGGTLNGSITFSNSGTSNRGIIGTCGDTDCWRVVGGATASNAGYLEIATGDDSNEPIYVRQYSGTFSTLSRTLTLLDGSGNTSIPGTLSVSGSIGAGSNASLFTDNEGGTLELRGTTYGYHMDTCYTEKIRMYCFKLNPWTYMSDWTLDKDGNFCAKNFVESGTSLSSKYAPISHSHGYLPLSGGTTTGNTNIAVTDCTIGSGGNSSIISCNNCTNNAGNQVSQIASYHSFISPGSANLNTSANIAAYECLNNGYFQVVTGHYNDSSLSTSGYSTGASNYTALCIGNGTTSSRSNAFRMLYTGALYAKGAYSASGADYAEYFEWEDGNPDNEDRRGYFVTLNGDKIRIASSDDYILGVVSGNPCVLGNTDVEWTGQFLTDEFGAFLTKEIIDVEIDENGEEHEVRGVAYIQNPDYDPDKDYIQRSDRKEWDAIGMLGVLSVIDNGTCNVNGYCKCENGIAVPSDDRHDYRVMGRINERIIKIILK